LLNDNLVVPTTFFLIFAWIVWPFFIPLFMLQLEKNQKRKKAMKILLFVGGLVSIFLANQLFSQEVTPRIVEHHILFEKEAIGYFQKYSGYVYFIAVIFPFLFSTTKNMKKLGAINIIAFLIAFTVYTQFLVSVWCFFAAIVIYFEFEYNTDHRKPYRDIEWTHSCTLCFIEQKR